MIMEWGIGDVVTMRKPHPCGSYQWRVTRLGADIGLRCVQCGRRVLLERRALEKRAKSVERAASPVPAEAGIQDSL